MRPLWGTKIKWVVQEEADWKEERRMASISLQHQEKEPSKVIYVLSEWVCPHRESSRVTTRRGRRYRRILSPSDHTLLLLYTIEPNSIRSWWVSEAGAVSCRSHVALQLYRHVCMGSTLYTSDRGSALSHCLFLHSSDITITNRSFSLLFTGRSVVMMIEVIAVVMTGFETRVRELGSINTQCCSGWNVMHLMVEVKGRSRADSC